MGEKLKMNLIVLLLCILINNIGRVLLSTDKNDCTHYKRNVWDDINTDQRLFVNCFGKDVESSRADLIVMLDRSGSMWKSSLVDGVTMTGYQIAKKFIKDLLSEVKISFNATRIAVITFGSQAKIDIDFIINPIPNNNKCEFDKLYKKLPPVGGGTNMAEAVKKGFDILSSNFGRSKVNQVGILLSDGYPNNPTNVTYEVKKFQAMSAILYTVAVEGADKDAMSKWASNRNDVKNPPTALHANTFQDMATLANNIRGGK